MDTPDVQGGTRAGVTMPCADGRVVTGGHVDFQHFNLLDEDQVGIVLTRRPASDGSGYVSLLENPPLGSKARITTYSICIARPAGYSIVQDSRMLNPRQRAYIDVACPAGSVVIGGGASTESGVYIAMSAPKLDGSAWSAYFRSDAIIGQKKAEAWAVCSAPLAGREVVSSPPVQLGPGVKVKIDVACPLGKLPLSFGHFSTATTVGQPRLAWWPGTRPEGKLPNAWYGTIRNNSSVIDNVTLEARLVAICATAN